MSSEEKIMQLRGPGSMEQARYAIAMLDDDDKRVRGEAFCSLILNENDISPMLQSALLEGSPFARAFCALVLANRGDSKAAPSIVPLTRDLDPAVRSCALGSLGYLRYSDAVPAIRSCMDDEHPDVRLSAAKAMADITGSHTTI